MGWGMTAPPLLGLSRLRVVVFFSLVLLAVILKRCPASPFNFPLLSFFFILPVPVSPALQNYFLMSSKPLFSSNNSF